MKALAAVENQSNFDGNRILDSGASAHMTPEVDNLSNLQEYSGTETITIGNGLGLHISHIGVTSIKSNSGEILPLINTLCVPKLKMNLISIQSMSKDLDCSFILNDSEFAVKRNKDGKTLLNGISSNGLYKLNSSCCLSENKKHMSAISSINDNFELWHKRCGHPSSVVLFKIARIIDISLCKEHKCIDCPLRKLKRLPFNPKKWYSQQPLETLYMDA